MIGEGLRKAVEAEIERVHERLETLRQSIADYETYDQELQAFLERHEVGTNGDAPAPAPPQLKAPAKPKARRPRKQAVKPPPQARDVGPAPVSRAKQGAETRKRIVAAVREQGPVGAKEIAAAAGITVEGVRHQLKRLSAHGGPLNVETQGSGPTAKKLYRTREADILTADSNGAKTGPERKVLEALARAPEPLTTAVVCANTGINLADVGRILQGLTRRGIVRALPRKSETERPRWEMAQTMAGAA